MGYISKYDTKFITYVNRKYNKDKVLFETFDDYIMWLFYDYLRENKEKYYEQLEEDMKEYSEWQERGKKFDKT